MRTSSILRWSGSKAKLLPTLAAAAPNNYLRYIEPFAGSACLFFNIKPQFAVIGDLNPQVIDVYKCIKSDPHGLADALNSIPQTREAFYTLREIDPCQLSLAHRAARLVFMMKACFNGVYRTNKAGRFNVPFGNRIYALPGREQLLEANEILQNTDLIAGDFADSVQSARRGDWVYMDPPYRQIGRHRGEYGTYFDEDALDRFVETTSMLVGRGVYVTISFSDDEKLSRELSGLKVTRIPTQRTVAGKVARRVQVDELIFTNY